MDFDHKFYKDMILYIEENGFAEITSKTYRKIGAYSSEEEGNVFIYYYFTIASHLNHIYIFSERNDYGAFLRIEWESEKDIICKLLLKLIIPNIESLLNHQSIKYTDIYEFQFNKVESNTEKEVLVFNPLFYMAATMEERKKYRLRLLSDMVVFHGLK